ncbi:EGF domain containing protein [Asbolus verrucosus]|uniref:EGF domain containing protein n=1 Tax=Asbolus verrucosus TaxID=1661398 RepID=A0A482VCX2_ASBVE|nr:EGF domain containing protein [Asbolus verrucosus]
MGSSKLTQETILRGNSSDACEIRDPCQHGGICISTDSGPICECRNPDYEGEYCEKDIEIPFSLISTQKGSMDNAPQKEWYETPT